MRRRDCKIDRLVGLWINKQGLQFVLDAVNVNGKLAYNVGFFRTPTDTTNNTPLTDMLQISDDITQHLVHAEQK